MSINRTLRPTTIVPAELYVERAADRQLRSIINDMGRPGYVLVARQMGKTNLLLNMKRERREDLVLYLDLSSRFETAQSWFRNVIDSLLESFHSDFPFAVDAIADSRNTVNLEPSAEFDRHMRQILRESKKRIVIILDEIDSLVNTSYSDSILSQVRSMYFSRANHPEYEKLTYVLSGVAEPTDLIKDKNISPFNIGEKIYLGNFDFDEFSSFLGKAKLNLEHNVRECVFDWTRGNPRMTWDVCSDLEVQGALGKELSIGLVNEIIDRLYLQEFDRAPVDHIRTLIESDQQIRSAIMVLRYGKKEAIESKIKSRLYLAGITNSAGGNNFTIANKIIDVAFPDAWIQDLDRKDSTKAVDAYTHFVSGNYSSAIDSYEAALSSNDGLLSGQDYVSLAIAYLHNGNLTKAIINLDLCKNLPGAGDSIQAANFHLGVCYGVQKDWVKSIKAFESAAKGANRDIEQHANLEIVNALVSMGSPALRKRALELSRLLIEDLDMHARIGVSFSTSRLISALYGRASLLLALSRRSSAAADIERAVKLSGDDISAPVLLCQYDISHDKDSKIEIARRMFEVVIRKKIRVGIIQDFSALLTKRSFARICLALEDQGLHQEFLDLLEYYTTSHNEKGATPLHRILDLCEGISDDDNPKNYVQIIIGALQVFNESEQLDLLHAFRFISINASDRTSFIFIQQYLEQLKIVAGDPDRIFDMENGAALMQIALFFRRIKNVSLTKKLFEAWNAYKINAASTTGAVFVSLDHFEMDFLRENGAIREARAVAVRILDATDDEKIERDFQGMDLSLATNARRAAGKLLNKIVQTRTPLREIDSDTYRGIERNQKVVVQYGDMPQIEKKFKVVEADLRNAICKLIMVLPV